MQHHSGSWYLPWGLPLQKMLALPPAALHPGAAAAAAHGGGALFHHPHQHGFNLPHHTATAMLSGLPSPLATHTLHTFVTAATPGANAQIPNAPQQQQIQQSSQQNPHNLNQSVVVNSNGVVQVQHPGGCHRPTSIGVGGCQQQIGHLQRKVCYKN